MLERIEVYGHNGPINCKAVEEKFVSTLPYALALSYGKINPLLYPCCYNYGAETGIIFILLTYLLALGVPFKMKIVVNSTKTMTPPQPKAVAFNQGQNYCLHNVSSNDSKLDICRMLTVNLDSTENTSVQYWLRGWFSSPVSLQSVTLVLRIKLFLLAVE